VRFADRRVRKGRLFCVISSGLFDDAVADVSDEYAALEHRLGWRFLCVRARNLSPSTPIALMTANPGGSSIPADHPCASCEQGSAYLVERWAGKEPGRHKLQKQAQELFNEIALACGLGRPAGPDLLERSLLAYFIPFRSPRLTELHRPQESRAFANRLWIKLFQHLSPRLIIAIDRDTHRDLRAILQVSQSAILVNTEELATGWGEYRASLDEFTIGESSTMVLRLPHLSTFQLFTSTRCRNQRQEIIARACRHLGNSSKAFSLEPFRGTD
jgi:hypothetical protein